MLLKNKWIAFILLLFALGSIGSVSAADGAEELNLIIDQSFDGADCIVGEHPPTFQNFTYRSFHISNSRQNFYIRETEKGTKYLTTCPTDFKKEESLSFRLNSGSEDCPVFELKMRVGKDIEGGPKIGRLNGVGNTEGPELKYPMRINNDLVDTDDEGFFSLKLIIKKSDAGYYYNTVYYTSAGAEKSYEYPCDVRQITSVNTYMIFGYYQEQGVVSPDNNIDIAHIRHYVLNEPKAAESNLSSLDIKNEENVSVTFNEKIIPDSISENTVKLIDTETEEIIPWTFQSYDETAQTAVFKVGTTYLDYDKEYGIDCQGVITRQGIYNVAPCVSLFTTPPMGIRMSNPEFRKNGDGVSFSASFSSAETSDAVLLAVLYDETGRIRMVKEKKVKVTGGGSVRADILLDYADIGQGYYINVICADNTSGILQPLIKTVLSEKM